MSAAEVRVEVVEVEALRTGGGQGTRREQREDVVRHVEYCRFPRASSDQRLRVGFTRDVSRSGLCVRVDTPEPVGSLLRVTLRGVDGRPRLESIARIAWSSPTVDGGYWIGLSLIDAGRPRAVPVRHRPTAVEALEIA